MKQILSIAFITLFITAIHFQSSAQGCVAVRSTGNMSMLHPTTNGDENGTWQLSTASRYFRSFRHSGFGIQIFQSVTREHVYNAVKITEIMQYSSTDFLSQYFTNTQCLIHGLLPYMIYCHTHHS